MLRNSICAFEIHPREAQKARRRVSDALQADGLRRQTATELARSWIRTSDFLLAAEFAANFTHAVGNPPYVRWSRIPRGLESEYRRVLPKRMTGGDIFIPFLDRALEALQPGGKCGFVCSDRWRYTAFAEGFRAKWLSRIEVSSEEELLATQAFKKEVDVYPTILIAVVSKFSRSAPKSPVVHARKTLLERGYQIKVGPALGCTPAYVLEPGEPQVEESLLWPWVDGSEIVDGRVDWRGRRIAALYDDAGALLKLGRFPLLAKRLRRFKPKLVQRSIVKSGGAQWFQPIDRVKPSDWAKPKLLIPEIAKVPRVALDFSGAIPSHGVYAIFAPQNEIGSVYGQLSAGGLARALEGIAPKIKGGYVRCYKRFLAQIRL
ncbi:Eco57I restriction-modification methylase domain-containing protein [Bradyrhizobium sp. YR681]|uniref:Eco57I restriction-modification methylase domain-containing protein n=1 Tax=Bradyrhizobium sp. YR681 TaxID=1144344 RepID=UPI0012F6FCAD|nr:hypothetical protein [Bradyrhizobium sp. YR681]